jgi:hypothetical protein
MWNTRIQLPDGCTYQGQVHQGVPEGRGTKWYTNGDVYEGQWVAGEPDGPGTMHYADGTKYRGTFSQGRRVNDS